MKIFTVAVTAVLALAFAPLPGSAAELPSPLAPGAPFPHILQEAPTVETIAPGVEYGEYVMDTTAGPLAIHVVAIAPHRSDVTVGEVLANDVLESHGETVGAMAKRTAAVAGINGDYFDIGNTNRPTNVVVRRGVLLQVPRKRYALAITRDGYPQITEFSFLAQIAIGSSSTSIDAIDQLPPPNGGTSLLTPEFGNVAPEENLTLIALQPLGGTPPLTRYRVTAVADNLKTQPPGYYVAVGPGAYDAISVPSAGDLVSASGDLSPIGLDSLATAIGGGPLILHGGAWYDDSDGPNGGEYDKRIPCSGAAIAPDGRLFLIEVDGRQPSVSVGITRREFAALMRALGATEGMAFDGGGSSTMVARRLGDSTTEMVNSPSDGRERRVANGVFVYSSAPVGPAVRLVAQPESIRAVPGAQVKFRVAAVDAASHVAASGGALAATVEPKSLGSFHRGYFIARHAGNGRIVLRRGALKGAIALEVRAAPTRLTIQPVAPNVAQGGSVQLSVQGFDPHGYPLSLPPRLHWKATRGSVDASGRYRAGSGNGTVAVRVGTAAATARVTVGSHEVGLAFAD
ncbi:MAG TPA: phosphodiester glycosidase family protein, partial [Candidatus Tumulicola sp.]